MTNLGLRALVAFLVLSIAASCATHPPKPALPDVPDTGELVFWEVESAHRPGARSWLLGSVHAATEDLVLDPAIDRAFEESDALVVEVDVKSGGTRLVHRTLEMAALPAGQTLDQILGASTWRDLRAFLTERNQPADLYRAYKPWLLLTMVSAYLFAEAGLPPSGGVDFRYLSRAEQKKLPIVALETPEAQLALFDGLSLETQAAMLAETLAHESEMMKVVLRTYAAWQSGDLAQLDAITSEGMDTPELRDFHERAFLERNRTMAARIDELMKHEREHFVVVGAGHMVGAEGIPTLLAARGHRVTRIAKTAAVPAAAPAPAP